MRARFFDQFNHMTMILGPDDPSATVRIGKDCKVEVMRGLEGVLYSLGLFGGKPRFLLKFNKTQADALNAAWFRRYRSTPDAMILPFGGGGMVLRTLFDLADLELVGMDDQRFEELGQLAAYLVEQFHAATGRYNADDEIAA